MTQSMNKLFGIVGGIAATALALPLHAQEEQGDQLEEVVVTGSYLYTGLDSPSPVDVYDGEDMMFEANPDMLQFFFENVTQNFSSDIGAQTNSGGNMGARSIRGANINLRGIGGENTLVVLNGRRTINYPVPDFNGWQTVDINSMVPRIAIQRSEILLDGGSATFGSDPVAGVVNFVTRNDFRGFDFSLDTRINEDVSDAKDYTLGALWGAGDDRTSIIAGFEFSQQDRILLSEIEGEDQPNPDVTPETGTGLDDLLGLNFDAAGMGMNVATWVDPDCGNPAFGAPLYAKYPSYEDAAGNLRVADATNPATSCSEPNGFDPSGFLQNNVKQTMIFVAAEHQLSDSLSVDLEVNFSRQRFDDVASWGDNSSQTWPVPPAAQGPEFAIPTTHPGLVRAVGIDPTFGTSMGMGTPVYMEGETLPFNSTMPAFNHSDLIRVAFGIEGTLPVANNWTWRVDTSAAFNTVRNGLRDMIIANLPNALQGYGGPGCTTDPADDPGGTLAGTGECYYYNPFMSAALPDAAALGLANNPEMLEWLVPTRVDEFNGEFWGADFLITGEFGELPGGPIGVAFGAGYRHEFAERDSDILSNQGALATVGFYNDWAGEQNVESANVEFALPILDNVDVQIAARTESYEGGFSETTPKVAVLWSPTDRLLLRGSYGTSFRGPSISHTSAAAIITGVGMNQVTVDGVTYGSMGGVFRAPFETRPGTNLLPQTADNLSFGFDYQINDRMDVGATWVSIDFKDRLGAPNAPSTTNSATCLLQDANGIPITSNGTAMGALQYVPLDQGGCIIPVDPTLPIDGTNVAQIVTFVRNLEFLEAEFLDFRASFNFDTPVGPLSFTPNATFTLKYDFPNALGQAGVSALCPEPDLICSGIGRNINATTGMGGGFNGVTEMPHWQGSFPLRLAVGSNHNLSLNIRYRDGLNAQIEDLGTAAATSFVHEEGQWTTAFNYSYRFNSGASSLSFGVNNLTATEPPNQDGARFNRQRRSYSLQFRHSLEN